MDVYYDGVDPNTNLADSYENMLDFVDRNNLYDRKKANMITQDFLTFKSDVRYDCVFTSPPYFDLELYCDQKTQSTRFRTG